MIHKKYFRVVNTLLVVIPMTLIMAIVGTLRNYGAKPDWILKMLSAWIVMAPIAFVVAFIIIPNARKATEWLTGNK